jgi:hypothetical protein
MNKPKFRPTSSAAPVEPQMPQPLKPPQSTSPQPPLPPLDADASPTRAMVATRSHRRPQRHEPATPEGIAEARQWQAIVTEGTSHAE